MKKISYIRPLKNEIMNTKNIEKLKQLIDKEQVISIIPHKNPDGDAMGSCLALYHYLKRKKHQVYVVSPTNYPDFLKWLPNNDEVLIFENSPEEIQRQLETSNIVFTLDFNALHRAEPLSEILQKLSAKFVMIDHHQQPDDYAEITFSNPTASSTCEIVYEIFNNLNDLDSVNSDIATCLYTGIMTDTGGFKYSLTSARTHQIVASLIEKGANPSFISSLVFDSFSVDRLRLLGKSLENLTFIKEYKTAYISLSSEDLKRFNFQKGDTEGIVNYGLKLKEAEFAAIFIEDEKENQIKISFRSKTDLNVNIFARRYFAGGGHINAAGGRSSLGLQETIHKFLNVLPEFLASAEARSKN